LLTDIAGIVKRTLRRGKRQRWRSASVRGELYAADITNGKIFALVGVPEPATLSILALGGLALLWHSRPHL
jgi:hypothetical protein